MSDQKQIDLHQVFLSDLSTILDSLISNPTKQLRVEVMLIQRLRSIDKEGIFLTELHNTYAKCDDIRALNKNSEGLQNVSQDLSDEQFQQIQLGLVIIDGIIKPLNENLYNLNNQDLAINMINEIIRIIMNKPFSHNEELCGLLIQAIYYHSRHYLIVSTAPHIIQKYIFSKGLSGHPKIISFQTIGDGENQREQCIFSVNRRKYICEYRKNTGRHSYGADIQISSISGENLFRFNLSTPSFHPANKYLNLFD